MPISLEPDQSFPIVLDSDIGKPAESRPTFMVRAVTMRGQKALSDEIDSIFRNAETTDQICDRSVEVFSKYVVGWENMGPHKHGCDIRDFLTQQEVLEVLRKVLANQHVQLAEKKRSE